MSRCDCDEDCDDDCPCTCHVLYLEDDDLGDWELEDEA
jgi:hypothetical protein